MGSWQSGPEPPLMAGAAGTRSLRMTLRMPAGALATFVDRLSSGSPRNIEQSAQPSPSDSATAAPATNVTPDRPFLPTRISRPLSVSRFAPRTSNLSLSEVRPHSIRHLNFVLFVKPWACMSQGIPAET